MRALCWNGVNDLRVETTPDPVLVAPGDAIIKVGLSTTCGSDLHFIDGYIPGMREGDIIGHEFMGTVVDTGPAVTGVRPGQRVVVPSFISCGSCWHCGRLEYSLCDNTNPNGHLQEPALGYPTAGIFGYTHAFGGYAGSHADYIRVPHADVGCFPVPDGSATKTRCSCPMPDPPASWVRTSATSGPGHRGGVGMRGGRADGPAERTPDGRRTGDRY